MPLSDSDFDALRILFQEELEPFRAEVNKRFDEVAQQMDGLYKRDEKREQEYLFVNEQIARLDKRVTKLEQAKP